MLHDKEILKSSLIKCYTSNQNEANFVDNWNMFTVIDLTQNRLRKKGKQKVALSPILRKWKSRHQNLICKISWRHRLLLRVENDSLQMLAKSEAPHFLQQKTNLISEGCTFTMCPIFLMKREKKITKFKRRPIFTKTIVYFISQFILVQLLHFCRIYIELSEPIFVSPLFQFTLPNSPTHIHSVRIRSFSILNPVFYTRHRC